MGEEIQFSRREKEVAELLVQGRSNKQIALVLGVSVRAVEFHLSHVYAKLGVSSRTEAALKLAEAQLGESTGVQLRESTAPGTEESGDNGETAISTRRTPMKNILYATGALLVIALAVGLTARNRLARDSFPASATPPPAVEISQPTTGATPAAPGREYLLEQIRQLAAEYDQAVQSAKQNGSVESGRDPITGEDTFRFKDETYIRISALFDEFMQQKTDLERLYTRMYRDEIRPTPFPTQSSDEQRRSFYDSLNEQAGEYCSLESWQRDNQAESLPVYDPDEGKYRPIFMGEVIARCEIYGQMMEELRTAPMLEKVDQEADKTLIRQVTGKPELQLTFQRIGGTANAMGRAASVYTDETGSKYSVDIETARLAQIEPYFPSHPEIAQDQEKSMDELRGIARQFAVTNSPRLAELGSVLTYEEGCKTSLCFFTWSYRNRDWSDTGWAMMPPFLQVGVLTNGQIGTYINTLDLY
jgi:DNA-binding CsgD family transcriptional regulator